VYDILRDIAEIYYDLEDTEQADLLETIAGKHRANDIAALISNWSQVESATEAAYNAAGTASNEQEKYMESMEGHLNQLQAAWEVFSNSFLESDALKTLIDLAGDFLSVITKIVDTFGTLPTLIVAVVTAMSFKNVGRAKMFALNGGKMPTVIVFCLDISSLTFTPNEIH
jgi:TP901 family phage tail tape measure protein